MLQHSGQEVFKEEPFDELTEQAHLFDFVPLNDPGTVQRLPSLEHFAGAVGIVFDLRDNPRKHSLTLSHIPTPTLADTADVAAGLIVKSNEVFLAPWQGVDGTSSLGLFTEKCKWDACKRLDAQGYTMLGGLAAFYDGQNYTAGLFYPDILPVYMKSVGVNLELAAANARWSHQQPSKALKDVVNELDLRSKDGVITAADMSLRFMLSQGMPNAGTLAREINPPAPSVVPNRLARQAKTIPLAA